MIELLRIDHRLLHGQVAFSWSKQIGTDCILLACDSLLNDKLRMSAKWQSQVELKLLQRPLMIPLRQSNQELQINISYLLLWRVSRMLML